MDASNLAVFTDLIDIVIKDDFNFARYEFFDAHSKKFEEEDENKLEYTEIHKQYVEVMEKFIDAKLAELHSAEVIEAFNQDFVKDHKKYDAIHPEAVDVLFGQVEFVKFKEQIIMFKQAMSGAYKGDQEDTDDTSSDGSQKSDQLDKFITCIEDFEKYAKEDKSDPALKWRKKMMGKSKDDKWSMESWIRPRDKFVSDLQESMLTMKDVTPDGLQAFMEQYDKQVEGNPYSKEVKMIKSEKNLVVFYLKTGMPGSDIIRQMCLQIKTSDLDDGSKFTITESVDPAEYGCGEKDMENIDMFKASKFWSTGDGLKMHEFTTWKAAASFPKKMMNMVMSKIMSNQFDDFQKKVIKIQETL